MQACLSRASRSSCDKFWRPHHCLCTSTSELLASVPAASLLLLSCCLAISMGGLQCTGAIERSAVCSFPANTNSLISPALYGKLAKQYKHLSGIKNTFQDTPLAKQFKDAAPDRQARPNLQAASMGCIIASCHSGNTWVSTSGQTPAAQHSYKQGSLPLIGTAAARARCQRSAHGLCCAQVYVGADQLSIATLEAGMDGVIGGGGSSILAGMFVQIWHLFKQGKREEAKVLQDRMNTWCACFAAQA